jgi:hypothetical protein
MFRETLMLLNRCRVPYAVSGAFALQVHTGIWRFTKDIDLFLAPEDLPAAIRCLQKNGFRCQVKDPVWLHKAHRDGFFVDLITGMSNAVITVERSWIENARPTMILDVRARVLAAEELLASKLFVLRRERFDGADIAHIVYASQGNLDWERVFELVKEHWEILLFALVLYRYVYQHTAIMCQGGSGSACSADFPKNWPGGIPPRRFEAAWWTTRCLPSTLQNGRWKTFCACIVGH